ncbi:MAG: serine/threonine protein kinase [Actinobacteria bacterium]|nr:serine/threonine protein kinase [Actinomycetota bacterium]MBU1943811.1 serine/threonine protein kinase [Actinomycetota bacterium]MBU2689028.1 serine/threonine protein kinase [Actinomycetota bacterium]
MEESGPRYKIEKELGRGAFGVVYLARDRVLGRPVALKVLTVPEGISEAEREHLLNRFAREARAAAGLTHPNIVIIHDVSRSRDRHFISMEYLEGQPLSAAIEEGTSVPRAFAIADQVLAGLEYAHSRDVIHRDIKPDNIFLLSGDRVKLVDFGLARVQSSSTLTKTGTVVGSPGYISPEIIAGKRADTRADIFSFGVVLYEMLTGERPFGPSEEDDSLLNVIYRIVSDDPPPPSSLRGDLPQGTDELVAGCLAKDPEMRYGSASEVRYSLASLAGDSGLALPAAPEPEGAPSSARAWFGGHYRALIVAAVCILAVALVALLLGLVVFKGDPDAARARRYMREGDRLKESAEKMAPDLERELGELETGVESKTISTSAQFNAQADSVVDVMDDMVTEGEKSAAEYKRIDSLRGVEDYKRYAAMMVEVIDLATKSLQAAQDTLDYLRFVIAGVEMGQQVNMVEYANRLQQEKDEVRTLNEKVLDLEEQAEKLKREKGL